MNVLDEWTAAACAELGVDRDAADVRTVLDLARDVAHGVARPAAPVGAFVLGVAVGSGQPLDEAARRLSDLAARWSAQSGATQRPS